MIESKNLQWCQFNPKSVTKIHLPTGFSKKLSDGGFIPIYTFWVSLMIVFEIFYVEIFGQTSAVKFAAIWPYKIFELICASWPI